MDHDCWIVPELLVLIIYAAFVCKLIYWASCFVSYLFIIIAILDLVQRWNYVFFLTKQILVLSFDSSLEHSFPLMSKICSILFQFDDWWRLRIIHTIITFTFHLWKRFVWWSENCEQQKVDSRWLLALNALKYTSAMSEQVYTSTWFIPCRT